MPEAETRCNLSFTIFGALCSPKMREGLFMRTIAIVLAALFVIKIAVQEYIWRAATEEALVAAYAERAVEACRHNAKAKGLPAADAARPRDVRFTVGNPDADVSLWDVNNKQWTKRYRTPYLRLTLSNGEKRLACSYDLVQKQAEVTG